MLIKKPSDVSENDVTPESAYLSRRTLLRTGVLAASVTATGLVYRRLNRVGGGADHQRLLANLTTAPTTQDSGLAAAFRTDEPQTPLEYIAHYNNFYEFS